MSQTQKIPRSIYMLLVAVLLANVAVTVIMIKFIM